MGEAIISRGGSGGSSSGGDGAIVKSYPIETGYTISSGDVVNIVNEKVLKNASVGTINAVTLSNHTYSNTKICQLDNDRFVTVGKYSSDTIIGVTVGRVTNNKIVLGSIRSVSVGVTIGPTGLNLSVCKLSEDKILICVSHSSSGTGGKVSCYVCILEDLTVKTVGTKTDYTVAHSYDTSACFVGTLSTDKCILVTEGIGQTDTTSKAMVLTVSGTTITSGGMQIINTCKRIFGLTVISSNTVVIVESVESMNHTSNTVLKILNISGNTVSVGAGYQSQPTTAQSYIRPIVYDGTYLYRSYISGGIMYVASYTVSGNITLKNTVSFGDYSEYGDNGWISLYKSGVVLFSNKHSPNAQNLALCSTIIENTGSTLTAKSRYIFDSINSANTDTQVIQVSNDKVVALSSIYTSGSGSRCDLFLLEEFNEKLSPLLINKSKDAIALNSGSAGNVISVAYSGTVNLSNIDKGFKTISDGVSSFAPFDNILSISPYWELPRVFGVYTGNGATLEINIGFTPSAVMIARSEITITHNLCFRDHTTGNNAFIITNNGFRVSYISAGNSDMNISGSKYYYICFR